MEKESKSGARRGPGDVLRMTVFSLWLSWQELTGRKTVFAINVILVALLIALPVSLDLVGKARKSSVGTRIDYLGPSLIIVPGGILSSDLVTAQMKGRSFPAAVFNEVKQGLAPYLRSAEARLTDRIFIEGRDMPASGIDFQRVYSYPFKDYSVGSDEVLLGSAAAKNLNKGRSDRISTASGEFTVAGIIPETGGIEDVSVFFPLHVLQGLTNREGRINEIRLYPESALSYEGLKVHLKRYEDELTIIDAYRGDTAERGVDAALLGYQKALYTAAFILIAFCIIISSYINLDGRKAEISTVFTLGAARGIIIQVLTLRTVWIAVIGSVLGQALAFCIAVLQDLQVPLRLIWSSGPFLGVVIATAGLGIAVTVPFALYVLYDRDLIADL